MIDINDIHKISEVIYSNYNFDLNNYSQSIYRRRITKSIKQLNFNNTEKFIDSISSNKDLFQKFLQEISVNETEMFRDPEVWTIIKETIIPKLYSSKGIRIWLPDATSGEELYSIAIILFELGYSNNSEIFVSNISNLCLSNMQKGLFPKKCLEINNSNYLKSAGNKDFANYYTVSNNSLKLNSALLENISFLQTDIINSDLSNIDLIIFRNKTLYFTNSFKTNVLNNLYSKLNESGFIILGIRETLCDSKTEFFNFDLYNKIYIK